MGKANGRLNLGSDKQWNEKLVRQVGVLTRKELNREDQSLSLLPLQNHTCVG